jgi:hypothetical protein
MAGRGPRESGQVSDVERLAWMFGVVRRARKGSDREREAGAFSPSMSQNGAKMERGYFSKNSSRKLLQGGAM